MLISRSKLIVKDNSGIILAQCIQVQRSKKSQKPCKIGDFLKATIKKGSAKSQTQRLKKLTGSERLRNLVVIQTRSALRRLDGGAIRFNANCGVTVNEKRLPLFKRVTSVVPFELKKKCNPVLNLARAVM
jgi:large subunit ribosomal protein L14